MLLCRRDATHNPPAQSAKHANADGNTSLHWACLNGHADVAALLLAAGGSASHLNVAQRTPVDEAQSSVAEGAEACLAVIFEMTGGGGGEEVDDVEEDGDGADDGATEDMGEDGEHEA